MLANGERWSVRQCLDLWPSTRARLLEIARQCSQQGEEALALQLQMACQLADSEYETLELTVQPPPN